MKKILIPLLFAPCVALATTSSSTHSCMSGDDLWFWIKWGTAGIFAAAFLYQGAISLLKHLAVKEGEESIRNGTDTFAALRPLLQEGKLPDEDPSVRSSIPFLLSKNEKVICHWDRAHIFTQKKRYVRSGKSSGVSFRVVKGVYMHTGGSGGVTTPVESMESQGLGAVVVTTNNLYYRDGHDRMKKLSTAKVIGTTAYIDAVGIEFEKYLPIIIKVPTADLDILSMAVCYHNQYLSE